MWLEVLGMLAIGAGALFVVAAIGAKERAQAHARWLCARAGVQLLDQTVALSGLTFVRRAEGPGLGWRYAFEYSPEGLERERAVLLMVGRTLVAHTELRAPPNALT